MRAPDSIPPGSSMGKELAYLHERIDQLIRQTAVEVGMLERKTDPLQAPRQHKQQTDCIKLALNRFQAADDAAAEKFGVPTPRSLPPRGAQRG